jgi:hypothetical protein
VTTSATRNGTKGERLIVNALLPYYPMAERRAKQGSKDRGDVGGIAPHVVIEAKYAPKRYEISQWLKEADQEGLNDQADLAAVWFKIKGTDDPLKWPVMMRGGFFIPLLRLWTNGRSALP